MQPRQSSLRLYSYSHLQRAGACVPAAKITWYDGDVEGHILHRAGRISWQTDVVVQASETPAAHALMLGIVIRYRQLENAEKLGNIRTDETRSGWTSVRVQGIG